MSPFSVFLSAKTCWVTQDSPVPLSWGCGSQKSLGLNLLRIFCNFLTESSLWGKVNLVQASNSEIPSLSFTLCCCLSQFNLQVTYFENCPCVFCTYKGHVHTHTHLYLSLFHLNPLSLLCSSFSVFHSAKTCWVTRDWKTGDVVVQKSLSPNLFTHSLSLSQKLCRQKTEYTRTP